MAFFDIRVGDLLSIIPTSENHVRNCHKLFPTLSEAWRKNGDSVIVPKPGDRFLVLCVEDGEEVYQHSRFLKLQSISNLHEEGWVELWEEGFQHWSTENVWKVDSRTK